MSEVLIEERPKVDIKPLAVKGGPIVLDSDRLMQLLADKLISKKTYVQLSLEIEYGRKASFLEFDAEDFAKNISLYKFENSKKVPTTIDVSRFDVQMAIISMEKNGYLITETQLTLHLDF
jgi:hypothetical protein